MQSSFPAQEEKNYWIGGIGKSLKNVQKANFQPTLGIKGYCYN